MQNQPPGIPNPSVCCVVVNWNGWEDTAACVTSLLAQSYGPLRVVIVDNGSTDGSADRLRIAFPQIDVIETGSNLGFASGSNVGIRRALEQAADLVWLLNNDTVAPPDTCAKLVAKAASEPQAGLVGSVLYFMHEPRRVQAWGGGKLTVWLGRSSHFRAPARLGPRTYLTFASVLIRREVLLQVGLLYEGFFMYFDDADYALRLTRAGYGMAVAENTAILHKEGGSSERRDAVIDRHYVTAGLHFLRRHAALPGVSMAIFLAMKLGRRVLEGEWKNARAVFLAACDYRGRREQLYREMD